jgi:hypothetical protein
MFRETKISPGLELVIASTSTLESAQAMISVCGVCGVEAAR